MRNFVLQAATVLIVATAAFSQKFYKRESQEKK